MVEVENGSAEFEEFVERGKGPVDERGSRAATVVESVREASEAPKTQPNTSGPIETHSGSKKDNLDSEIGRRPSPLEKPERPR